MRIDAPGFSYTPLTFSPTMRSSMSWNTPTPCWAPIWLVVMMSFQRGMGVPSKAVGTPRSNVMERVWGVSAA